MRKHLSKLLFLTIGGLTISGSVYAQLILNQPNTSGAYTSAQSITLSPGFSTTPGQTFSAKIQIAPKPPIVQNPSQNQNYIVENRIRVAGITNNSQIQGLSADELQQTITYYDGLGRPMQQIQTQASPSLQDIITPILYDPFGRIDKKYLSYSGAVTGDGSYKSDAINELNNFYNPAGGSNGQLPGGIPRIASPYSQTVFESSPLNRPLEQGAPGTPWQPSTTRTSGSNATGRTVVTDYGTNSDQNGLRKVKLYRAESTSSFNHERNLVDGGWYQANQLYVTITKDENWTPADNRNGTMEVYTDKEGQTILKRSIKDSEILSTYYVYDDFSNLIFVIPSIAEPDNGNVSLTKLNEYCYQYFYDGRKRLVEKKMPGKAWEYLVYNKIDQLVMTQDGKQRAKSPQQWTINKYDALGRLLINGLYDHVGSTSNLNIRPNMQSNVDAQTTLWENRIATGNGYTNVTWPNVWATTLVLNYYDDYAIPGLPSTYVYASASTKTKTLLTASRVKILNGSAGTDDMLWTVSYFDDNGREIKTFKQHYKDGLITNCNYDELTNTYDFIDQVLTTSRKHFVNGNQSLIIDEEYVYDHSGRKKETWETINGINRTLLVKNNYNPIGQLIEKKLHSIDGNNFAQTVTYSYNERGWMETSEASLFAMELQYTKSANPQYNGNISGQLWGIPSNKDKSYNYSYDKLNRLTSGISNENFDELLSYDKAGNILSLQRKGSGNTIVDQLSYGYNNSNRLDNVMDAIPGNTLSQFQLPGQTNYMYDENGNLISRNNIGNGSRDVALSYNLLNLPYQVSGTHSATYIYDADGRKLRMVTGSSSIDYIDGIQYTNSALRFVQNEAGRAVKNGNGYNYEYTLTDHLGNSRVSFDIYNGVARKIQQDDYYPFGLSINRYASGETNKKLFNGKELQDGLNVYDYGARFYDPVIGRFGTIDRFSDKYYSNSPYSYASNNPALNIDVNGDSILIHYRGQDIMYKDGKLLNKDGTAYAGNGAKKDKNGNVTGYKGFLRDAFKALNEISSAETKTGTSVISDLQNSKNTFTIENAANNPRIAGANEFKDSNRNKAYATAMWDAGQGKPQSGGSGGTVYWDPAGGSVTEVGGGQGVRPTTNLAHELGHASDANKGWSDNREINGLSRDERRASYFENQIRGALNLPFRSSYGRASGPVNLLTPIPITSNITLNLPTPTPPPSVTWLHFIR